VGWGGGGGEERTACAKGCHVKGAVACAWQATEANLSQSKQEVALSALALDPATTAQNESVGAAAEEAAATEEAPAAEELALNAMTLVGRLRSRVSDSHCGRTEPYTVLLVNRAASDKLGMVLTLRREGVLVQDRRESIVFEARQPIRATAIEAPRSLRATYQA
jgi:hypothetical protein